MNRYRAIVALILSAISIVVSVIALCRTCPHTSDLGMDYQGVIVGILALLVTVLIGWNIYALIDFDRAKKEIDVLKDRMYVNTNASLALKDADVFMIYHYLTVGKDPLGIEYRYIHSGLTCLVGLSKIGRFEACNVIVQSIIESVKMPKNIFMLPRLKEELLSLLSEVQQPKRINNFHEVARIVALISVKGVDDF